MAIRIGCGSWRDKDYIGLLYPKGLPEGERLAAYTCWFERIELNATYHAPARRDQIAKWADQTPAGFLFDVKLHQNFSNDPLLAAKNGETERFIDALQPLIESKKLGAFLLTLAPRFGPPRHRLADLDLVAEKLRPFAPVAVELRHRGWVDGDALASTLAYFRSRKLAWVALDLPRLNASAILPPIDEVTLPALAYMRLHGRNPHYLTATPAAERHNHDYTAAELGEITTRIRTLETHATDVHVSVNNHHGHFAPKAALALRRLLGQPVPPPLPTAANGAGQLSLLDEHFLPLQERRPGKSG